MMPSSLPRNQVKLIQLLMIFWKYDLDWDKQGEGLAEYLGINIQKLEDGMMEMTQYGLIKQIIEGMNLQNANPKYTPVTEGLAKDKDGTAFNG